MGAGEVSVDGRSDHPTDVLAKQRIRAVVAFWNLAHPDYTVEFRIAMPPEGQKLEAWIFTMLHAAEGEQWYTQYMLPHALIDYLGERESARKNESIRVRLMSMKSELEEMVSRGAHPAT